MSSFFEFGKTTIKVPNKMIFVNNKGYDNLADAVTKGGSISSRFGIKSLNIVPTESDKIEIVESSPREFKPKPKAQRKTKAKVNVKKEAEDLLSEMMNTKINKKMEMQEMPEPKKQNDFTLDDFKSVEFLRKGIDLYYRDKDQRLTNLQKFNMEKLKNIVIKRKINLDELVNFYNLGINNMIEMYKDSNSDKIKKLRKKWNASFIKLK